MKGCGKAGHRVESLGDSPKMTMNDSDLWLIANEVQRRKGHNCKGASVL